jgi:hypothetical protein
MFSKRTGILIGQISLFVGIITPNIFLIIAGVFVIFSEHFGEEREEV